MNARKPITKKTRFDVFKRDHFVCQYCGNSPPTVILEVDHIDPVANGGDNSVDNLLCSCFDCNRGKGATVLTTIPNTVAEKARVVQEKADQLKAYEKTLRAEKKRINASVKRIESVFREHYPEFSFEEGFKVSIRRFLAELPCPLLEDAMGMACTRIHNPENALKYFCGIAWRKIKECSE